MTKIQSGIPSFELQIQYKLSYKFLYNIATKFGILHLFKVNNQKYKSEKSKKLAQLKHNVKNQQIHLNNGKLIKDYITENEYNLDKYTLDYMLTLINNRILIIDEKNLEKLKRQYE